MKHDALQKMIFELRDWASLTFHEFMVRKEVEVAIPLLQTQLAELQFIIAKYEPVEPILRDVSEE
jgi:hypothetical protein